mgnify:CR=1 FL=1
MRKNDFENKSLECKKAQAELPWLSSASAFPKPPKNAARFWLENLQTKLQKQDIMTNSRKNKWMKRTLPSGILWLGLAGQAMGVPTLQLDIEGGTYDEFTDTIVAPSDSFTLYAYLIPDDHDTLDDSYYISAALVPETKEPGELGSFVFSGNTISVTSDMTYGVPPLESVATQLFDRGDLERHGIFYTYFEEFGFQFDSDQYLAAYNTADRARSGSPIPLDGPGQPMYYVTFRVDISGLQTGYAIHFDLYNTKLLCSGDVDVTLFAPFSHDAQSGFKVPEASTLCPLALGLLVSGFRQEKERG